MIRILLVLATLSMAGGCVSQTSSKSLLASNSSEYDKTAKVTDPAAPDAVSCRDVMQTGSRVTVHYCMTNKEWKERERRTQEGARQEMLHIELGASHGPNAGL